jgi:protein-S-isoprenylcysteine O-methyltransferase Ste14
MPEGEHPLFTPVKVPRQGYVPPLGNFLPKKSALLLFFGAMTNPRGKRFQGLGAALIVGFVCFFVCFAAFVYAGLWLNYIKIFGRSSSKETALICAMLLASLGIAFLAVQQSYKLFNKFMRSRPIPSDRDKW